MVWGGRQGRRREPLTDHRGRTCLHAQVHTRGGAPLSVPPTMCPSVAPPVCDLFLASVGAGGCFPQLALRRVGDLPALFVTGFRAGGQQGQEKGCSVEMWHAAQT